MRNEQSQFTFSSETQKAVTNSAAEMTFPEACVHYNLTEEKGAFEQLQKFEKLGWLKIELVKHRAYHQLKNVVNLVLAKPPSWGFASVG